MGRVNNMEVYQSSDLMRFITGLKVNPDNTIVVNILDQQSPFISRFYTPKLILSSLSVKLIPELQGVNIIQTNKALSKNTVTAKISASRLKIEAPYMYLIAQSIVMECFALIYSIEEKQDMLRYIEVGEVKQVRDNINYLADYLADKPEYSSIVTDLHDMEIAVGYIENQIPIIQREIRLNGSL
ncbi:putative assembly chaperone [Listeria phage vB_Lino_VEfB7]|nr:putative assembly chaperone [Listeria phage vB_Lino_VEfB7]